MLYDGLVPPSDEFPASVPRRSQPAHAAASVHHPVSGARHPEWADGLDGLAARWTKQYTKLGLYLDPIADKLLLSTLFVVLTHMNLVPRYVTVLVLSRDLGILLIATLLFATGTLRDFRPSLLGKFNTLVQIFGLTVVLVEQVWPSLNAVPLRLWLLRSIAWLAPISAAQYAWIVVQRVNAAEPQAAQ